MKNNINLSLAEIEGYARVRIGGETLRLKIIECGKGKDVWGEIGIFQYNISKIYKGLKSKKLDETEWDILEILPKDYDYKPIETLRDITNHVHHIKIADKLVCLVINYNSESKMWNTAVYNFYPNPVGREMGGRYHSLEEYVNAQEENLRKAHQKFGYGFIK